MKQNKRKIFCILCGVSLLFFFVFSGIARAGSKPPTVVLMVYGNVNEGSWDPVAYQALLKIKKDIPFTLYLNEQTPLQGSRKSMTDWAVRGVDMIYAHSYVYNDELLKVAKQFKNKNTKFIGQLSLDPRIREQTEFYAENTPQNMAFTGETAYDVNYLAGYAAALASKTGKIGIIQPYEMPDLNRDVNSFLFGAQAAKPDIKTKLVIVGDWIVPAETRDAVQAFAKQGFDVVYAVTDDDSAILEAAVQGIYVVTKYSEKHQVAPKAVLTGVIYEFAPIFRGLIGAIANGTFADYRAKHYFNTINLKLGSAHLGKWGTDVPENIKKKVAEVKEKMIRGEIEVKLVDERLIK